MERNKLRTGSLKGGAAGTRVHPDSAEDREARRMKALQQQFGDEEVEHDWAVVERGRTVECPIPDEKKFVGYDKEGKSVYGPKLTHYGPGSKVYLPVPEIIRLRELGFLVDPNKKHNIPSKSQGHSSNEPRSRVTNPGSENIPGAQIHQ